MGRATFKHQLEWDGTSSLPAWVTVLLRACGYVESAGTLTPRSEAPGSNVKTITLAGYSDGYFRTLIGAVGTFRATFPTGRPIVFEFDFQGQYGAEDDVALIAPTYPSVMPTRFAGATLELDDVALRVESVVFDAANEIKLLEDPATVTGYRHGVIVDRQPKITINPESVLQSTQDRWAAWVNSTSLTFELDQPGPDTSVFTLDCDNCQITNKQPGDRGKVLIDQIDLAANYGGSADTDVKMIFTPTT